MRIPDLTERRLRPEIMDTPGLDRARHTRALVALARVNLLSLTAERVWREVVRVRSSRPYTIRVLDVACGGGDVVRRVARRARRGGVPVEVHGCDLSPVALEVARRASRDERGTGFFELDVQRDTLPDGYDVVCSSLFLHHLSRTAATRLLRAMCDATRGTMLVQDLRRTRLGYLFAWAGLMLLTRSDVARADGLTSVAGAFSMREVAELCADAGLPDASVRPCWPQRYVVRWSRS